MPTAPVIGVVPPGDKNHGSQQLEPLIGKASIRQCLPSFMKPSLSC